jgi:predicted DCC family thiol-disulfide oxidoreductase YuxK
MYDGDCGFCSRIVHFVLKHGDKSILFTPLNSETAAIIFKENGIENPDMETFYFLEKGVLYERSKAAFHLSSYLRFPYSSFALLKWFPAVLSDPFYKLVARNRKRLAGESCILPSPEERKRFI